MGLLNMLPSADNSPSPPRPNVFGDVGSNMGNEMLSSAWDAAQSANGYWYPFQMGLAGLLAAGGLAQKGVGYGSEILASGTNSEQRMARDILGMFEAFPAGGGRGMNMVDDVMELAIPAAKHGVNAARAAAQQGGDDLGQFLVDEAGSIPVYQGRSKKGINQFFNPQGVSWGTTSRETAEQFAGKTELSRMYPDYPGEVHNLNFDIRNPMDVDISETLWSADREMAKVAEAKAAGFDGLRITHPSGKIDYVAFDPSQVSSSLPTPAAQQVGGDVGSFKLDNPGGRWLEGKIARAGSDPARLEGSVTGYFDNDFQIPVRNFDYIDGARGERRVPGEAQYNILMDAVRREGWEPTPILVGVNDQGRPYVVEGNTRLAVAKSLGIDTIPAEVRYWNGGEANAPMRWTPEYLERYATPTLPTPRNEAEAMAKRVLDLRGAGRASEVTEDMMAAADPSYMFRNTPLDMSQEARTARLDEYWPASSAHGSGQDIAAVDNERLIGDQFWSTDDLEAIADGEVGAAARGVTIPLRLNAQTPAGWSEYDKFGTDELIGRGYDSLALKDEPSLMNPGTRTTYVSYNPEQVRSIFARADPEFRHLANLSAGLGGIGLLGTMNRDDLDRETAAYLGGI